MLNYNTKKNCCIILISLTHVFLAQGILLFFPEHIIPLPVMKLTGEYFHDNEPRHVSIVVEEVPLVGGGLALRPVGEVPRSLVSPAPLLLIFLQNT